MKRKGKSGKTEEAQGLVMEDFSRQFRGGRWKQLWGMKEVDERRKGISLSAMISGCQSVVWGRLQVFEEMQEIAQVILKLLFDCLMVCLRMRHCSGNCSWLG